MSEATDLAATLPILEEVLRSRGKAKTPEQEQVLRDCQTSFAAFLPYWQFVNRETGDPVMMDNLWAGQEEFADLTKQHPWIFALKAGKLGFTELECAYDGWVMRFRQQNARVHVFSRDASAAEELLGYVKFGLTHLPGWMQLPMDEGRGADIDRMLRFKAGPDDLRTIVRYAAGANVSIDQTASHSHVDELARMPYTEQTWTSIETTISPEGTCHIVTRGAGAANYSADLWTKALQNESQLHAFFAPWWKRPREEGWYDIQKGEHTPLGLKEFCPESWEDAIGGPGADAVVPLDWIEKAMAR